MGPTLEDFRRHFDSSSWQQSSFAPNESVFKTKYFEVFLFLNTSFCSCVKLEDSLICYVFVFLPRKINISMTHLVRRSGNFGRWCFLDLFIDLRTWQHSSVKMDFNSMNSKFKKFAGEASTVFNRAVQVSVCSIICCSFSIFWFVLWKYSCWSPHAHKFSSFVLPTSSQLHATAFCRSDTTQMEPIYLWSYQFKLLK